MTVNSLSDNPWFDLELSRHFRPHEACWGFDLDRDGYRGEAKLALGRREEGLRDMQKVLELKGIKAP